MGKGPEVTKNIKDLEHEVGVYVEALKSLHRNGQLDDRGLFKSLVVVSMEYATNGFMEETIAFLETQVPMDYFKSYFLVDLQEDVNFCRVCTEIAAMMIIDGRGPIVAGDPC